MDSETNRTRAQDRARLVGLVVLAVLAVRFELSTGWVLHHAHDALTESAARNALAYQFSARPDTLQPLEANGKFRIVYVSNSHARSGGEIARHVQRLLDAVAPAEFEVFDLADPGIFAPDMLQRILFSRQFDPDLLIIGSSYIAYSDRMKLALQGHSVRSFMHDGVRDSLSLRFWLRHYDLDLYLSTLVAESVNLYRYRNDLRDRWEQPLVAFLAGSDRTKPVHFLEVDQHQAWRFPDGYDRNLFQWHLYAYGREKHLTDMREAVAAVFEAGIPLIAFNTPVDWKKSFYQHDEGDYAAYQDAMADLFGAAADYVDYQPSFPVAPLTYDALHPTWHGARLFAFDIVLRLARQGVLDSDAETILMRHVELGAADGAAYRQILLQPRTVAPDDRFRRYDIAEAANAAKLLDRLLLLQAGSKAERDLLYRLSLHLRLLTDRDYHRANREPGNDTTFERAIDFELEQMIASAHTFAEVVGDFQAQRLIDYPRLKSISGILQQEVDVQLCSGVGAVKREYRIGEAVVLTQTSTSAGRVIAETVSDDTSGGRYRRVDIFGDGSFVLLESPANPMMLPEWLCNETPLEAVGS